MAVFKPILEKTQQIGNEWLVFHPTGWWIFFEFFDKRLKNEKHTHWKLRRNFCSREFCNGQHCWVTLTDQHSGTYRPLNMMLTFMLPPLGGVQPASVVSFDHEVGLF